ncbi:hypothetical protein CC78DRAFT_550385 [Lojkania enalia]|uniref:Uncharacterized protein n=1 Tax=Lojkania enalia TaxID=147567 RepID=A0A9P4TQB8_9PLEO|nr:hypothetical protein CC78DRAFT_550385 [Didymosphaeria enalia]
MTTSISSHSIPSEFDDEVNYANPDLTSGRVLRSKFLFHLQEQDAQKITAITPAARRTIEKDWWHTTDPNLPPPAAPDFRSRKDPDEHVWVNGFRDDTGRVIRDRGRMKQMELHRASRCRENAG